MPEYSCRWQWLRKKIKRRKRRRKRSKEEGVVYLLGFKEMKKQTNQNRHVKEISFSKQDAGAGCFCCIFLVSCGLVQ